MIDNDFSERLLEIDEEMSDIESRLIKMKDNFCNKEFMLLQKKLQDVKLLLINLNNRKFNTAVVDDLLSQLHIIDVHLGIFGELSRGNVEK